MDRLINKEEIERLENIVYLYNRESRGWHDCNDIRLNSNDIKAIEKAIELIRAIPPAEPYKGMTNGEVLEAVFPNIDFCIKEFDDSIWVDMEDIASFRLDWWNSPYEPQESEE